ncbi:hypothetical protein LTR56_015000 [Elasticomyces elasticus]|nr:hypothetical protein LTR56_015000 [Elasticomyces elasticus]KAK3646964.1 hypothetical protein LTR22_013991 [Elasticomyces elasticus]KAK4916961.1 hypothetical protein LTR49_015136 [Elasticomyces elasticus]KAK5754215.1 hypothetical protein LTS12_015743 [Elasticomyces elasticus]
MERRAQVAEARLAEKGEDAATARQSPELDAHEVPTFDGPESSTVDAGLTDQLSPTDDKRWQREFVASARVLDAAGHRAFVEAPNTNWQDLNEYNAEDGISNIPSYGDAFDNNVNLLAHELEAPPTEADDFSWDEQSFADRPESRHDDTDIFDDDETSAIDGMASLSVEDKGAGYLGVASGAAMLRLLLPDAEHRRPLKRSPRTGHLSMSETELDAQDQGWVPTPVFVTRDIASIDLDAAINSYFSLYHVSYPIVHEASFRAQYAQVIARPSGRSWNALAYMIGAIGLFTTGSGGPTRDADLFEAAKANMTLDSLESGNLSLVQTLILMSNYLQKRNKPNSGYNYLGLALHMAMGIGLHKEFHNWRIAPLSMEIRRRVWYCLQVFAVGAMITFGRPLSWPKHGIEVTLPLNIDDRDLTNVSASLPPPRPGITTYSSVSVQARFHLATNDIYSKVISVNFPTSAELVRLDDERIEPWRVSWFSDETAVAPKFMLARRIMEWRYRNFRVIMYRPFVIRHVLQLRTGTPLAPVDSATSIAIQRCLHEAKESINSIYGYWMSSSHNRMSAWYALYHLFQAALIPVMCLRNDPTSDEASDWRSQIQSVLTLLNSMQTVNPASKECRLIIMRLCAGFLDLSGGPGDFGGDDFSTLPVEESPQTQLSGVYSMMWPSANTAESDVFMQDHNWSALFSDLPTNSAFGDETTQDTFWE